MDSLFTRAARAALDRAANHALERRQRSVEPRHLLLALLEGPGAGPLLLEELGVNRAGLAGALDDSLPRRQGTRSSSRGADLPYTRRAEEILTAARESARDDGRERVGTADLVLVLVTKKGITRTIVREFGIDGEDVRRARDARSDAVAREEADEQVEVPPLPSLSGGDEGDAGGGEAEEAKLSDAFVTPEEDAGTTVGDAGPGEPEDSAPMDDGAAERAPEPPAPAFPASVDAYRRPFSVRDAPRESEAEAEEATTEEEAGMKEAVEKEAVESARGPTEAPPAREPEEMGAAAAEEAGTMEAVAPEASSSRPTPTPRTSAPSRSDVPLAFLDLDEAGPRPLYRQIADGVEEAAATGAVEPGARLPSIRVAADALSVSSGTVARAYRILEEREVVRTRGTRGTYVAAPEPATATDRQIRELAERLRAPVVKAYHMGLGHEELHRALDRAMEGILIDERREP